MTNVFDKLSWVSSGKRCDLHEAPTGRKKISGTMFSLERRVKFSSTSALRCRIDPRDRQYPEICSNVARNNHIRGICVRSKKTSEPDGISESSEYRSACKINSRPQSSRTPFASICSRQRSSEFGARRQNESLPVMRALGLPAPEQRPQHEAIVNMRFLV